MTKAVSDQIGGGGMADEVIRFNGFPFLEKEDKEADHDASFEPSESNSRNGASAHLQSPMS